MDMDETMLFRSELLKSKDVVAGLWTEIQRP